MLEITQKHDFEAKIFLGLGGRSDHLWASHGLGWSDPRWVQKSNFWLSFKIQFQLIFWGLWTLVSSSDKFRAVLGILEGLWLSKSCWAWKARLCTRTLKRPKIQKWKSDLFGYPKRRFDTFFDPKGSNIEFWPRVHGQIDEKKILPKIFFEPQAQ